MKGAEARLKSLKAGETSVTKTLEDMKADFAARGVEEAGYYKS